MLLSLVLTSSFPMFLFILVYRGDLFASRSVFLVLVAVDPPVLVLANGQCCPDLDKTSLRFQRRL